MSTQPICLIDADPIKYKCGFSIEKRDKETDIITIEHIKHAYYNVNSMIRRCIKRCETDRFQTFVTPLHDRTNFRFALFPDYKANRATMRKPHYIQELHTYLINRWKAIESIGEEADDTVTIAHCTLHPFGFDYNTVNSVVCSIDKDFDNVPGWHYNPGKDTFYFVDEITALRNFYLQILTGDVSDNVPRVKKGWLKKKTEEKIQKALTEAELCDIIFQEVYSILEEQYKDTDILMHDGLVKDFIKRNGQLVWLRRKKNEIWEPNFNEVAINE